MSDDYPVQNIYRYCRKTYKDRSGAQDNDFSNARDTNVVDNSPRSDAFTLDSAGCSCDFDAEGEIGDILHKKCPVITLAQKQLLRLLDETNKLVSENTYGRWSPLLHFLCVCKELALCQNKCQTVLVGLIFVAFFVGLLLGAATCGMHLGKFNSPIMNCIDNFFVPDSDQRIEDTFRCIA